jgi:Ca-activated chloride channel family protein
MIDIAYPHLFWLLPLPWLLRALLPPRRVTAVAVRVPFGSRLRAAASGQRLRARARVSSDLVPGLVWLLVLGALIRPQWVEAPLSREQPTRDLLLLVDLSASMSQEDFVNAAGAHVDRLTAVKEVLGDFLARREGDRVGLVVFGDAPYLQAPLSTDRDLARRLLDETAIGMAGPRTAFGDAIGLAITLFADSDAPAKTVIALTDGNDTVSQVPPIEAARVARQRGIRIHAVAIGDPATAGEERLDEATLHAVAETGGGGYFFAADRARLEGIYQELDRVETRQIRVLSYRPRRELFHWPLLAALLLSVLAHAHATWRTLRAGAAVAEVAASGTLEVDPASGQLQVRD